MRILIDILHPADINFFKNAIKILLNKKHKIFITYTDRGNIESILKKEYADFEIPMIKLGTHHKKKFRKIIGIPERVFKLIKFMKDKKFDKVISFQSFYLAMAAKFYRIPSIIFYDDYEYKSTFNLCKIFASRFVLPSSIPVSGKNIYKTYDFKELAYLHPTYFKPNIGVLKEYNLKPGEYVFIREISNISLNYSQTSSNLDSIIKHVKKRRLKIILSLEDKSLIPKYNKDCIILNEPVSDIYSLINFAKCVVTSGDTIAREAALLGVPTIYTGKRKMSVNKQLINAGYIKQGNTYDYKYVNLRTKIIKNASPIKYNNQDYKQFISRFRDTTKVIVEEITK
ncbi:MAG: DUF354 domain-containing protein [Candidatus Woesearchaeota archaeon]